MRRACARRGKKRERKKERAENTAPALTLSPLCSHSGHRYGVDSLRPRAAVNPALPLPLSPSAQTPPPFLLLLLSLAAATPLSCSQAPKGRRLVDARARRCLPIAAVAQHGAVRLRLRRRGSGRARRRRRGQAEAAGRLPRHGRPGSRSRAAPEVPLLRAPLGALPLPPPPPPRLALRRRQEAGILS